MGAEAFQARRTGPVSSRSRSEVRRPAPPPAAARNRLLVDGHVHFHDCFEIEPFLEGAVANFRAGAWELGLDRPPIDGCLLLAESAGHTFFRRLKEGGVLPESGSWSVRDTGEAASLFLDRDDGARLLLIAGRQIVTRESVEVLALGSARVFGDGRALITTLADVERAEAVPVLPWGLGKWLFQRGDLVESVLEDGHPSPLFLGDNSGRPSVAPIPGIFRTGATRGVRVLPGSDPLPLRSQQRNAGRYGFVLERAPALETPARSLVAAILESEDQPRFFGTRERLGRFLHSQLQLRWRSLAGAAGARSPGGAGRLRPAGVREPARDR